jgi:prepilin-type N-terminal cleavage/methylation domain-containing protein
MLNKIKNRKEEGFTIIEVLIVLAIAGLILLVVFLAVPALQRNSRNTSLKNDVQNVLGGITEYQNVNSGSMPTGISTATGTVSYTGGTTTTIKIQGTTDASLVTTAPSSLTPGQIRILIGTKCNGATSARASAAYYALETSATTPALQCQDS